ncbi:MAG: NADPH-dependent FMN reductase [Oceanicoccus sp.]
MDNLKLLALSGSLRATSYNAASIAAIKAIAASHIELAVGDIGRLPLFNPDRENDEIPALDDLKIALNKSDGLIIASPEYAHGISGPLKNALDWLVSDVGFPHKPVMLINTSPRAFHAQEALKEVLTTMSANIIDGSCVTIPLLGRDIDHSGIVADRELSATLKAGLDIFCREIEGLKRHANVS